MGDLEEEFKRQIGTQFADFLEHPASLLEKANSEVDKITDLASAKDYLKRLNKFMLKALWFIIQCEIQGR